MIVVSLSAILRPHCRLPVNQTLACSWVATGRGAGSSPTSALNLGWPCARLAQLRVRQWDFRVQASVRLAASASLPLGILILLCREAGASLRMRSHTEQGSQESRHRRPNPCAQPSRTMQTPVSSRRSRPGATRSPGPPSPARGLPHRTVSFLSL